MHDNKNHNQDVVCASVQRFLCSPYTRSTNYLVVFHSSCKMVVLQWIKFAIFLGLIICHEVYSFVMSPDNGGITLGSFLTQQGSAYNRRATFIVKDQRWNREIDENSRREAQGGGMRETVAGAVLGGLILGPFGALFGASIGANVGAKKAELDARRAEMERLGISQEMLDMAKDVGLSLESSMEGIQAIKSSLETQQKLAKRLDQEVSTLYDRAKAALDNSDDDLARKILMERAAVQDKLKKVLIACAEEKGRLEKMKGNVEQLERRALEIDALLRRSVSARSRQNLSADGFSLQKEDPLLQKFKDIGID